MPSSATGTSFSMTMAWERWMLTFAVTTAAARTRTGLCYGTMLGGESMDCMTSWSSISLWLGTPNLLLIGVLV